MPLSEGAPVRPKVGRQAENRARRRTEILDAAVAAFTEKGFNGTSLRDVAARAGLTHPGLAHHFADKAALLEGVLDRRSAAALAAVPVDPHDGMAMLRSLVGLTEHDLTDPDGLRMFRVVSAEALAPAHPAHGYFRRWYAQVRSWARTGLADLERRELLAPAVVDLDAAAAQIAGMRDGLDPQWLLDPDAVDLVVVVRAHLQTYCTERL
ncbi:TetR/AcrR family transcriptional regulator [Nocardioides sp. GY 10127]|uniref:TetR/AcrR family transcriptional regulator n=1 Tax=Nocardioides sp. GY 10127 TaxID=2569762 RepID=UPI0010A8D459|nr:TetR/AcrR family transcriptional regulator [Nocardioides sp. GY 10127]TIC85617.1 TetR/AcrR family transcriptional regulator [Nocardioides sp. GY 10127]